MWLLKLLCTRLNGTVFFNGYQTWKPEKEQAKIETPQNQFILQFLFSLKLEAHQIQWGYKKGTLPGKLAKLKTSRQIIRVNYESLSSRNLLKFVCFIDFLDALTSQVVTQWVSEWVSELPFKIMTNRQILLHSRPRSDIGKSEM